MCNWHDIRAFEFNCIESRAKTKDRKNCYTMELLIWKGKIKKKCYRAACAMQRRAQGNK